ncbi:unnamed protein product [Auanema sp. JU1783]|nr:unnamed protein product [Auanema sp. JU1783]
MNHKQPISDKRYGTEPIRKDLDLNEPITNGSSVEEPINIEPTVYQQPIRDELGENSINHKYLEDWWLSEEYSDNEQQERNVKGVWEDRLRNIPRKSYDMYY